MFCFLNSSGLESGGYSSSLLRCQIEEWVHLKAEMKGHPGLRTKTMDPMMETLSVSLFPKCIGSKSPP